MGWLDTDDVNGDPKVSKMKEDVREVDNDFFLVPVKISDHQRKALANALASAPSMWILGNAGMGALQRLAEDHNPAVASKAIDELKQQWEVEEGDTLRFIMNQQHLQFQADDIKEEEEEEEAVADDGVVSEDK